MLNKERNTLFCILNFKNTLSLVPRFDFEVTGLMKPSPAGDIPHKCAICQEILIPVGFLIGLND